MFRKNDAHWKVDAQKSLVQSELSECKVTSLKGGIAIEKKSELSSSVQPVQKAANAIESKDRNYTIRLSDTFKYSKVSLFANGITYQKSYQPFSVSFSATNKYYIPAIPVVGQKHPHSGRRKR
ncbi:MAG TPA: hypothetical protein VHA13_04425 [Gammaproteobacteria bacterium]|nr:hypothetical protein [Gammaproteobacteria bacterium]